MYLTKEINIGIKMGKSKKLFVGYNHPFSGTQVHPIFFTAFDIILVNFVTDVDPPTTIN